MSLFDSISGSVGATLDAITPLFMETEPDNHEIAQLSNLLTMSYELIDQSPNPVFIDQSDQISDLLASLILSIQNIQSSPDDTASSADKNENIFLEFDGDDLSLVIEEYEYKGSDRSPEIETTDRNLDTNTASLDNLFALEQTHVEGEFG